MSNLTATQTKQIAYLEKQNDKEIAYGMWGVSYKVTCKECKESKHFGAAEVARRWVEYQHAGHSTWVDTIRS